MHRHVGATLRLLVGVATLLALDAPALATEVELYTRPGCPHCAEAHRFLDELGRERTDLSVVEHDIMASPVALEQLRAITARGGVATPGVPTFVIGEEVIVGFNAETTPARKIVGGTFAGVLGRVLGGLAGGVAAAATGAATSFATTWALGHAARQYYAQERTISADDLRAIFGRLKNEAAALYPRVQNEVETQAREIDVQRLLESIRG